MELSKIEKLLERYDEGETSLKEEELLRDYFLNEEVPAHLSSYKLMFRFSANQKEEVFIEETALKSEGKDKFTWASIAAILIIAVGLFFFNNSGAALNQNDLGTIDDEESLARTKEALVMVSQLMNEGTSDLKYLKEFNNTKNKIIEID